MSKLQTLKRTRQDACIPKVQGRLILQYPEEESPRGGSETGSPGVAVVDRIRRFQDSRTDAHPKGWSSRSESVDATHPPTYRKVVAGWTDDWRERWGCRANSLEDVGLAWRDAETQAFVEILNQIRENSDASTPSGLRFSERSETVAPSLTDH